MSAEPDHYAVLGLQPGATRSEVRAAYHRQARRWHPDFHAGSGAAARAEASRRMQAVNAAWAVLGDAVARRAYDQRRNVTWEPPPPRPTVEGDDEPDQWVPETPPGPTRPLLVAPVVLGLAAIACAALSLVLGPALLALAAICAAAAFVLFVVVPMVVLTEAKKE